jgi:hypothetical protein
VEVEVLDLNLMAAVSKFAGEDFGETRCPFPD